MEVTIALSVFSLKRKEQLRAAEITHVLSVARMPFREDLFQGYEHLQVEVDDVEDDNLLEHFSKTNRFIQDGLDGGGGVFVHWYVSLRMINIQVNISPLKEKSYCASLIYYFANDTLRIAVFLSCGILFTASQHLLLVNNFIVLRL